MIGKASRLRFRLGGAVVAALLMVSPVLSSHGAAAAQSNSDLDPDAAQTLLDDAQSASRDVDPIVDGDSFTVTQSADTINGSFLADADAATADFYLEYTVEAPSDAADDSYDFGVAFRYNEVSSSKTDEYRFVISSDDPAGDGPNWIFSEGTDTVLADTLDSSSFDVADGATYDVMVAVIGDEAAFSVNGEAVGVFDISDISDPGQIFVGSGFLNDTTVDGRDLDFSDISLFSLDDANTNNGTATEEATDEPTEEATQEGTDTGNGRTEGRGSDETPTPTEEATETPTSGFDTYLSPTYNYSLEYDDSWSITDVDNNPNTDVDLSTGGIDITKADSVILDNGTSSVALYGGESTLTVKDCVQQDIAFFQNSDAYDFFSVAKDSNDKELEGDTATGDGYFAVIWVTNTSNNADTTIYIECRPIVDGESMLLIEQYAADADYNDQIDAREALLSSLDLDNAGASTNVTPESDDNTPEADNTPETDETPTEEAGTGDINVSLDSVGTSDVTGDAVVSASGTTRSTIDVVAPDAPEGTLVIVQEGSCDDLSGNADFDAGALDANGESSERIRITPDDLDGNYALTLVDADTEDYAEPLACGDIG